MRSAQKSVLEGNGINIPSRTQLKESDKNYEFTQLILFSLFNFTFIITPFPALYLSTSYGRISKAVGPYIEGKRPM
jgi:hypothetical protein